MKVWAKFKELLKADRLRSWLTVGLLCSTLVLTACGSSVPTKVVKQALTYQLADAAGGRQSLVGYATLQAQTKLLSVSVQDDQVVNLPTDGSFQVAHQLTGSYSLQVRPVRGSTYKRDREPFELILSEVGEGKEARWQLMQPQDPDNWSGLDFS